MLRAGGARLLDEVERSGARRLQTARAWPRAAQHNKIFFLLFKKLYFQCAMSGK